MDLGILVLRLVVGLTLAAHGSQKLFGWFGGHGLAGTGSFLEQLGFRPGRVQAALSGLAEAGGGLLLAAGFATPLAAAAIVAVMLVAVVSVNLAKGFFVQNGGYEYPLVLAASAARGRVRGPRVDFARRRARDFRVGRRVGIRLARGRAAPGRGPARPSSGRRPGGGAESRLKRFG